MPKIDCYQLETAFATLQQFDLTATESDFIEVTLWHNGEGFDVNINSHGEQRFQLTWGQFKAIRKLLKELDDR